MAVPPLLYIIYFNADALFNIFRRPLRTASSAQPLAIALQSLVISGAYLYTRRLWLVWGLHVGWNYFQGTVFGMSISGTTDVDTAAIATISGPDWLTGGSFGIEGSYIATALVAVVGLIMILKARGRNNLLGPMWVKKLASHPPPTVDHSPQDGAEPESR